MSFHKTLMFSLAVLFASQAAAQSPVTYLWGVNAANHTFRRGSAGWEYLPGPSMKQVSIGADGTVWALNNTLNNVLRWNGSGWQSITGQLKQISVGSAQNVWGVNAANEIFRWTGADWQRMQGSMSQVSVGADGTVWALNPAGNVFLWTGSSWQTMPGQLKHISVGSAQHVWGVNFSDHVFRRQGSEWQRTDGFLMKVSVSADGEVWGVNAALRVFRRIGSTWQVIDGLLVDISAGPTVSGQHSVIGSQIWLDAAPTAQASTTEPVTGCPAGWRPPTKDDLDALLQYAQSRGNATAFLTSPTGFRAAPGDAIISSTKVFPHITTGTDNNAWMFWALVVNQASVVHLNTYFPGSSRRVSRCIRAIPTSTVEGDLSSCTVQFGSTVDARSVSVSSIQVSDLVRQPKNPATGLFMNPELAPITPHPDGGGYILWTSTANRAMLTRIYADGNAADVAGDEDLGPAVATGALATNGQTIGYLLKSSPHKLEFRVKGGATAVIMDNNVVASQPVLFSGRGIRFNDSAGNPVYGTEAMYSPMDLHRGSVLFGGGKWFASFDHYNNFNAYSNPGQANFHTGAGMTVFNGDGSQPGLVFGWGASHSVDMRAIFDGERVINIHLGDAFPLGLEMRVTDAQSGTVGPRHFLFAQSKFADTLIGHESDGREIYGIAGDGAGQSAGKLGDLVQAGCGQYTLTYTIRPATFTYFDGREFTSTPDELGFLVLDKDANIVTRTKLRQGSDVETLKSVRYGKSAILVAWKTKDVNEYWMMLVDARGNVLQDPQKLPPGVVFTSKDTFAMMKNGDVMWTTSEGGNLKLFRLPAPQ